MADGLPNTNPMLGRLNKSAEETNELNKQIKEEGVDTNEAITAQLGLISSFTEVMKNYIPKLGFIDAHTQALKLKQDQAFKVLEKIEGHLAKQAEIVDDGPQEQPDADAEDVLPDEEVGGGGDGTPQPDEEAAEDTRDADASPLEQIAADVSAIRQKIVDGDEDTRDPSDPVEIPDEGGEGGAVKPPKGAKKLGGIGKFLNKIGKLFSVLSVIVMALVASLLTANSELFSKIKELFGTIMQVFTKIVGIVVEKVLPAVTQIFGIIIDVVNQLLPPLMDVFSVVVDVIMQVVNALIPAVMAIVDMLVPVIISIVDTLIPIFMSIVDAVMPIIEMILDILVPIIQVVLDVFLFIFENILAPIFSVLAPIITFVGNMIMGFFNMLISVWNGIIEAVAFIAGIFGKGDEVRSLKVDKLGQDDSEEEAKKIDFSQEDEAIEAQIQAKVDSGEINEKTAEKLRKDKDKHRKAQEERRQEVVAKYDIKEVDVAVEGADGEKIKLISMDLEEATGGYIKQVLFDPESQDEDGNFDFYKPDGTPMKMRGPLRNPANLMAAAAKKSLKPIDVDGEGEGGFDIAGALGLGVEESTIGQDLADDSLDTADAQTEAANADSAGGGNQTVVSSSSTVGGSNQKTVILNDAASGSPQDGRGFYTQPN